MEESKRYIFYFQYIIKMKKTPKNQIMSYYKINLGRVETRLVANKNKSKVSQIVKF